MRNHHHLTRHQKSGACKRSGIVILRVQRNNIRYCPRFLSDLVLPMPPLIPQLFPPLTITLLIEPGVLQRWWPIDKFTIIVKLLFNIPVSVEFEKIITNSIEFMLIILSANNSLIQIIIDQMKLWRNVTSGQIPNCAN